MEGYWAAGCMNNSGTRIGAVSVSPRRLAQCNSAMFLRETHHCTLFLATLIHFTLQMTSWHHDSGYLLENMGCSCSADQEIPYLVQPKFLLLFQYESCWALTWTIILTPYSYIIFNVNIDVILQSMLWCPTLYFLGFLTNFVFIVYQ